MYLCFIFTFISFEKFTLFMVNIFDSECTFYFVTGSLIDCFLNALYNHCEKIKSLQI